MSGPGPLNALANGCPYIQPKFVPPRGRKNEVRMCVVHMKFYC